MGLFWLGILIGLGVGLLAPAAAKWARKQWFKSEE